MRVQPKIFMPWMKILRKSNWVYSLALSTVWYRWKHSAYFASGYLFFQGSVVVEAMCPWNTNVGVNRWKVNVLCGGNSKTKKCQFSALKLLLFFCPLTNYMELKRCGSRKMMGQSVRLLILDLSQKNFSLCLWRTTNENLTAYS